MLQFNKYLLTLALFLCVSCYKPLGVFVSGVVIDMKNTSSYTSHTHIPDGQGSTNLETEIVPSTYYLILVARDTVYRIPVKEEQYNKTELGDTITFQKN